MSTTYYVSIGNSDDKLTQERWYQFVRRVDNMMQHSMINIHGRWFAAPDTPFQNACWCIDVYGQQLIDWLRLELGKVATQFGQESIAFATATTEFIQPS